MSLLSVAASSVPFGPTPGSTIGCAYIGPATGALQSSPNAHPPPAFAFSCGWSGYQPDRNGSFPDTGEPAGALHWNPNGGSGGGGGGGGGSLGGAQAVASAATASSASAPRRTVTRRCGTEPCPTTQA